MGVFCLGALLSKEEAVLLPLMLMVIASTRPSACRGPESAAPSPESRVPSPRSRGAARWQLALAAACAFAPLVLYAWLRSQTGAMTPASAPAFYQFSFDPWLVLKNVAEYADRSSTLGATVVLACAAAARFARPAVDRLERRAIVIGIAWLSLGFGLTVWLPVRSSLYACFPSVGSALIAAALASAWSRAMSRTARLRLAVAFAVVPFLLLPVYRARNARWVRGATFSSRIVSDLGQATSTLPPGSLVLLHDDRPARMNLAGTFGTLIDDAVVLAAGRPMRAWIEPPVPDAAAAGLTRPADPPTVELWLANGRLREKR
jgi:hypothetical protein